MSYAKRARAIIAKYKRRLGEKLDGNDPMAQAAMQKELDELMMDQENAKASMVQNQYQEMAYGGKLPMMLDGGTNPLDPKTPYDPFAYDDPNFYTGGKADFQTQGLGYTTSIPGTKKFSTIVNVPKDKTNSWWSQIPMESKIGAGIQGITALTQMGLALGNKPKNLDYRPIGVPAPEEIRNDEQLAQATRSFRGAQNNLRYLSPSQYMAAMNDLATREAATKAGIIEGTENTNVDIRNRNKMFRVGVDQQNEMNRQRVNMYNTEQGNQYLQNIATGIGNIGAVGAGAMKDLNAYKSEQATLGFMDQPGYGHTYVGSTLVSTIRPAPGFEHYKDPKTGKMVFEHMGKKLKDSEEYTKLLMAWKAKQP